MERARRFERPTLTLARLCSTPELRPRCQSGRRGFSACRERVQVENWMPLLDGWKKVQKDSDLTKDMSRNQFISEDEF